MRLAATDPAGGHVLLVESIRSRRADRRALTVRTENLLALEWEPVAPVADPTRDSDWLVLEPGSDPAGHSTTGHRFVILPVPGAADPADHDQAAHDRPADDLAARAHRTAAEALAAAHRWLSDPTLEAGRLILATRGAVAAEDGDSADPATAAGCGLIRTAQIEHPGRFQLLDLDTAVSDADWPALRGILAGGGEPQLIV